MANIDIQRLFLKLGQLQDPDETGLSPRDRFKDYLNQLDTQIQGAE